MRKDFFYEAPAVTIVNMAVEQAVLSGSGLEGLDSAGFDDPMNPNEQQLF